MIELERIKAIRKSTRDIVQHLGYLNNLFADIGSVSQCYASHALERQNLTLHDLSSELSLDRSTVSRLAQDLVRKGYCMYLVNDKDGRSRYLELSELGKNMLHEIHTTAIQQVQSALAGLTDEEKDTVSRGLSLYASALKKESSTRDHHE